VFLLYYPLKQGLKHNITITPKIEEILFLLYYSLKQGLKLSPEKNGKVMGR